MISTERSVRAANEYLMKHRRLHWPEYSETPLFERYISLQKMIQEGRLKDHAKEVAKICAALRRESG